MVAHTADCPVAADENPEKKLYAIQFHPEVLHTVEGSRMLHNFVRNICGCAGTWRMDSFVEHTIKEIREKVGDGKVLLALSGGVDSSVAAGLFPVQSENSLPVYSSITVCSERTKFLREITHTVNAFNDMADIVRLYSKKPEMAEQRLENLLSEVLYEDSDSV